MVALSVSISAMTSPGETLSPSFFRHLARLPFSIVGESAGMRMLMGMACVHRFLRLALLGAFFSAFCLGLRAAGLRGAGLRFADLRLVPGLADFAPISAA